MRRGITSHSRANKTPAPHKGMTVQKQGDLQRGYLTMLLSGDESISLTESSRTIAPILKGTPLNRQLV